MPKKKIIRETHFLPDDPEEVDELGPHKTIAQAIANVLHSEVGGKAIALTGSWGSGKSTVVKIIKNEFLGTSNPDATKVFEFDAWGHEGDPLRRIFLEKLIDKVSKDFEWVDKDIWKKEKDKLSKQKKTTNSESWPVPTFPAITLAITIFISAVCIALISHHDESPWYLPWVALLPVLLLVIFGIGIFGEARLSKSPDKSEGCNLTGNNKNKRSWFAVGVNQTGTTTWTETTETPGPTSIEFQDKYHDLLEKALTKHENRKLLIVVDNLDRVDPDDALNIWATMRTFLEFNDQKDETWQKRVWLLVPYDPSALNKLWYNYSDNATGLLDDVLDIPNNFDYDQESDKFNSDNDLVTAFTEKTFQITFHLPPPVLTRTHDYLEKQFKIAFPWHKNTDEFHKIYRIFIVKEVPEDRSVVPRDIKIFINRIVSIYRQIGEDVPLPVQALYAAIAKGSWRGEAELLRPRQIKKNIEIELRGLDWEDGLAAIYFNVDIELAKQLLLGGKIEAAIYAGNAKDLGGLQGASGFAFVCEKVLSEKSLDYANRESAQIGLAAFALGELPEVEDDGPEKGCLQVCWDSLVDSVQEIRDWRGLNPMVAEGINNLLHHRKTEMFHQKIIESLGKTHPEQREEGNESVPVIKPWIEGIIQVMQTVHHAFPEIAGKFLMGCFGDHYISAMRIVSQRLDCQDIRHLFKPKNPADVQKKMENMVTQGEVDHIWADALMLMVENGVISDVGIILEGVESLISRDSPRDFQRMADTLSVFLRLRGDIESAHQTSLKLVEDGSVLEYLNINEPVPHPLAAAISILLVHEYLLEKSTPEKRISIKEVPGSQQGRNVYTILMETPNINPEAEETTKAYSELLSNLEGNQLTGPLSAFYEVLDDTPSKNFARAVIRILAERDDYIRFFPPEYIRRFHYNFRNILPADQLERIIRSSIASGDMQDYLRDEPFSPIRPLLYKRIIDTRPDDSLFVQLIAERYEAITSDDDCRKEAKKLEDQSYTRFNVDIPALFITLVENGSSGFLGPYYKDLMIGYSNVWQANRSLPEEIRDKGLFLVDAFEEKTRREFLSRIKQIISDVNDQSDILEMVYGQVV